MASAMSLTWKKPRLLFGILSALGLLGLLVPLLWTKAGAEPEDRVIRIEASSFAFDPGVVSVNPGDRVTIELVSTDVVHGLHLDGYDLQVTSDPGQTGILTFTADRPGSFRFRCSVTCGGMHPFMIGKLQVGSNVMLWRGVGLAVLAAVALICLVRYEPA